MRSRWCYVHLSSLSAASLLVNSVHFRVLTISLGQTTMTLQGWASLMRFTRILPFFALFAIVGAAFYPGLSGLAQEEEGTRPRQASVPSVFFLALPPLPPPYHNPQP